jgi:hypothetical protein
MKRVGGCDRHRCGDRRGVRSVGVDRRIRLQAVHLRDCWLVGGVRVSRVGTGDLVGLGQCKLLGGVPV